MQPRMKNPAMIITAAMQPIQQSPSIRIGERLENFRHIHNRYYATFWLHVKQSYYRRASEGFSHSVATCLVVTLRRLKTFTVAMPMMSAASAVSS